MKLKDLPEEIQLKVLEFSNKIIRSLEGQPVELIDILDKAVIAGMALEATMHNSKAENLWQTLQAFLNLMYTMPNEMDLRVFYALVEQCLIENKPQTIMP